MAATDYESRLKEVMANIDLLKEIMNNDLLTSDESLRLRAKEVELGAELDVMVVSDFSVGKLDLPQISEDLLDEFFAKELSSEMNESGDAAKRACGQFEDGEFGVEELFFPSVFCCIIISIKKENWEFLSCLVIYPFEIWAGLLRPENEF
ncbi:hypothetical protein DY000_02006923 [Brassica cretica]|uniref:Uncharacterized protein n=1 Tax=Brassica cretica TaxID=69181 RepID=A0ABQ7C1N3_BRACR|nr:hypothetical protein DY000_02006923 [Brassica cretica]